MTSPKHSPAPWNYEYNPYRIRQEPDGIESELAAFEVFDAEGNKIFDTNEDTNSNLQEANARLGATAPRLLAALILCADLLEDYDEAEGEEGDAYREATAAIGDATGSRRTAAIQGKDKDVTTDTKAYIVTDTIPCDVGFLYRVEAANIEEAIEHFKDRQPMHRLRDRRPAGIRRRMYHDHRAGALPQTSP